MREILYKGQLTRAILGVISLLNDVNEWNCYMDLCMDINHQECSPLTDTFAFIESRKFYLSVKSQQKSNCACRSPRTHEKMVP